MVPSSFMISQMTPAGMRPASRARSTAASVWPARTSTPPGWRAAGTRGRACTRSSGPRRGSIATMIVRARSGAEMPVVMPCRASIDTVKAVRVGRLVAPHHRLQAELVAALLGEGEADQPAAVGGHEVDGLGGGELRRHHQVALVLAVLVVEDHDHPARRGSPRSPRRRWRSGLVLLVMRRPSRTARTGATSDSTYFATTSTSRFTARPTACGPRVVTAIVCGIRATVKRVGAAARPPSG